MDLPKTVSRKSSSGSIQLWSQLEDLTENMSRFDESQCKQSKSMSMNRPCPYGEYTPGIYDEDISQPVSSDTTSVPTSIASNKRKAADDDKEPVPLKLAKTDGKIFTSQSVSETDRLLPVSVAFSYLHMPFLQNLPWAVQWEIARLILAGLEYGRLSISVLTALGKCDNTEAAISHLQELARASTADIAGQESSKINERFASAFSKETAAKSPWGELDREDRAIKEYQEHVRNCKSGPTCMAHKLYLENEAEGWYGGKVHFTGKLKLGKDNTFAIELARPYLSSSNRFARRFGSGAFIRIRIDQQLIYQQGPQVLDYFRRPFIVSGKVFRSFFAKERSIFLFRTNELVEPLNPGENKYQVIEPKVTNPLALSLLEFFDWHNCIRLNAAQSMAKWAARFALGLSNSIPGVEIAPECFKRIDDILSPEYNGPAKDAPTHLQMSDGCGLCNANLLHLMQAKCKWNTYPTAVQMRINGAKGLLVLHPDHAAVTQDRKPQVWVRDSQMKIVHSDNGPYDPALYTVDILRSSHMATPAHLAVETIINLAENGVTPQTFADLMKVSLREKVDGLTIWDDQDKQYTLLTLWANLAREGGVFAARLARMDAGTARAKGYVYEDRDQAEDEEDEDGLKQLDAAVTEQSSAWWDDTVSGCPSSLEEIAMELLDAGFTPDNCPMLRDRLKKIAYKSLKSCENRFRFGVPMSCSAFVIPDPTGVLAPGEVHIKSSSRSLTGQDGMPTDIVLGDVLLTRFPCKVPTDVQKAIAVLKHELRNYVDVIIVSTRGHVVNGETLGCHLASMTGGGDYDGDLLQAFWQPELVTQFRSADKHFVEEPDMEDCLIKTNETVAAFLERVPETAPYTERIWETQKFLLSSLVNSHLVGTYSNFWETSIYKNGYSHPETVLLAYLFCKILDGGKTGVTIRPERFKLDVARYKVPRGPRWKEASDTEQHAKDEQYNNAHLKRPKRLGPFIMDQLTDEVKKECAAQRVIIDERLHERERSAQDQDLVKPWLDFKNARVKDNELAQQAILEHVKAMREVFVKTCSGPRFTDLPIVVRQDRLRELSKKFAAGPDVEITIGPEGHDLATLKASCAYLYDSQQNRSGWSRFPFNVAFRSLCEIKAKAVTGGLTKTVTSDFYTAFTIKPTFLNRS